MLNAFLIVAAVFWGPIILVWWMRSVPQVRTATGGIRVVCIASVLMFATYLLLAIGMATPA